MNFFWGVPRLRRGTPQCMTVPGIRIHHSECSSGKDIIHRMQSFKYSNESSQGILCFYASGQASLRGRQRARLLLCRKVMTRLSMGYFAALFTLPSHNQENRADKDHADCNVKEQIHNDPPFDYAGHWN